jgi:hypothetical protein
LVGGAGITAEAVPKLQTDCRPSVPTELGTATDPEQNMRAPGLSAQELPVGLAQRQPKKPALRMARVGVQHSKSFWRATQHDTVPAHDLAQPLVAVISQEPCRPMPGARWRGPGDCRSLPLRRDAFRVRRVRAESANP